MSWRTLSDYRRGLYFYNARWCEPGVGRFLQADTVVPDGAKASIVPLTVGFHEPRFLAQLNSESAFTLRHGHWPQLSADDKRDAKVHSGPLNPQELNRYSYVRNNPLTYSDPSGHCPQCAAVGGMIVIGGPPGWFVGGLILIATVAAVYAGTVWMSESIDASAPHEEDVQEQSQGAPTIDDLLDNPESFSGATPEEVEAVIPDTWVKGPAARGDGVKHENPARKGQ